MTKGFSLLEFIIYFALISTVLTGVFHFVTTIGARISTQNQKISSFCQLCSAFDLLTRDIAEASFEKKQWKNSRPNVLEFAKENNNIITWQVQEGKLLRTELFVQHEKKENTAILADSIKEFSYHLVIAPLHIRGLEDPVHSCIVAVKAQLANGAPSVFTRHILLKNRVVT